MITPRVETKESPQKGTRRRPPSKETARGGAVGAEIGKGKGQSLGGEETEEEG